jgi:hypothetical protein
MKCAAAIVTALLFVRLAAAEEPSSMRLVAIVAPTSTIADISAGDLRRTYLGSLTRWPNGHRIIAVVLPSHTREQRGFLKHLVQMTDIDYAQHWIGEVFRGRASAPPHVAASPAEAVRFVATHPDAIAVVAPDAVDGSVRVLSVDGKSADASDYPLAW